MPRGRKTKSVLNQEPEVKVTVSETDAKKVEELHNIDLVKEAKEMASENFDVPEENVKVEVVSEEPVNEEVEPFTPESVVETSEEKTEATSEEDVVEEGETVEKPVPLEKKLSAEQMKLYQRTGILPK